MATNTDQTDESAALEQMKAACDDGTLKKLKKEHMTLETLRAILGDLTTRTIHYIADRVASSNEGAVLNCPDELLAQIFTLALQDRSLAGYFIKLNRLRRVCKRWQAVVDGTPSLWSVACGDDHVPVLERALVRSKETLLEVEYNYRGPWSTVLPPEHKSMSVHTFFAHLIAYAYRWRSAKLIVADNRDLKSLEGVSFPNLQRLSVLYTNYASFPLDVFLEEAHQLHSINLRSVQISWDWATVHRLTSLEMSEVLTPGLTPQTFFDVLRASPGLVVLKLQSVRAWTWNGWSGDPLDPPVDPGTAPLPELRMLNLYLATFMIRLILRHTRIPNCTRLAIQVDTVGPRSPENSVIVDGHMDHLRDPFRNMFSLSEETVITLGQGWLEVVVCGGGSEPTCLLHLSVIRDFTPSLRWLLEGFLRPPCPSLTVLLKIETNPAFGAMESWPLFLEGPYAITKLQLHGEGQDATTPDTVLASLSQAAVADDGRTLWPLPELQVLSLGRAACSSAILLDMLKRRYGRDSSSADGIRLGGLPEPLMGLAFTPEDAGGDPELLQEIKSIVGVENVYVGYDENHIIPPDSSTPPFIDAYPYPKWDS